MYSLRSALFLPALTLSLCCPAQSPATPAPNAEDSAFVAKVSQGGAYEVEASRIALHRAVAQDVKDLALSEVHDHSLVNAELKTISDSEHILIEPKLNGEFQTRLDHLKVLAGTEFDDAYLADMAAIHDKDEKLFAAEAIGGGASAYKIFAAKTNRIVKRHIGALHGSDAPVN